MRLRPCIKALAAAAIVVAGIGAGAVSANPPVKNIIIGTPGPDLLVGTKHADFISGRGGPDFIVGRKGNDILWGMWGNDRINASGPAGHSGSDRVRGGPGNDTCIVDASDAVFSCETVIVRG